MLFIKMDDCQQINKLRTIKLEATSSTIVRIHPGYNHLNINKLSLTRNLQWKK